MDLPDVRKWSEGPPLYPGVVVRSSIKSVSGREYIPDVRKWSEVPLLCPGVVEKPSVMSRSGRKALCHVLE